MIKRLWFLLGTLLLALNAFAAPSGLPVWGYLDSDGSSRWYSAPTVPCNHLATANGWSGGAITTSNASYPGDPYCYNVAWGPEDYRGSPITKAQSCNGDGNVAINDPAVCVPPTCTANETGSLSFPNGWSIGPGVNAVVGQTPYDSTMCDGTCMQSITSIQICGSDGGATVDSPKQITCYANTKKTGASCTTNTIPKATAPPAIPTKKPPCDASEGVMTTSSGSVKCVPPGTPSAEKPAQWVNKSSSTAPDGTVTETIKTTTRDPTTGAESSTTTTKTYPPGCTGDACASSAVTGSSEAPKVPTPESGSGGKGDQSSDFCLKNANLQICKGGLNEEATQKLVEENTKAIREALDGTDVNNDDIDNATANQEKIQEATDAYTALENKLRGPTDANADQASFSSDLGTWFDPIPAGSCSPLSASIGGRTFTLDPCPVASKVSDIAAYCLWIYLAFTSFALVTRKAE